MRLIFIALLLTVALGRSKVLKATRTVRAGSLPLFVVDETRDINKKKEYQIPNPEDDVVSVFPENHRPITVTLEQGDVFTGVGYQRVAPPDTDGSAGTTHYVQAVNGQDGTVVLFKEKSTGDLQGPFRLGDLAPKSHPCSTDPGGDPIVVWDATSERWWLSEFTTPSGACGWVCHYVSNSADPSDDYTFYAYEAPAFPDYPHYGSNGGDLFFGAVHQFDCNTFAFKGTALVAFDRKAMLAGTDAKWVYEPQGSNYFPMPMPALNDNPEHEKHDPKVGHYTRSRPTTGKVEVFHISVDWTASTPKITKSTVLSTELPEPYSSSVPEVPQYGVSRTLDVISDRDMYSPHFRHFEGHDTIVGCRTVKGEGGRAAPLWWKLDRNHGEEWKLTESGVLSSAGYKWMCSPAIDKEGTVVLGYSYSNPSDSSDRYVGIGYQAVSPQSPEYKLASGSGTQTWAGRWGDYAALEIDPSDGCTFWWTTEIIDKHDEWATRVGTFKSTTCQ